MLKRVIMLVCCATIMASGLMYRPAVCKAAGDDSAALQARLEMLEKEMADIKKLLADKDKEAKAKSGIEFSGKVYAVYDADPNGTTDKSDNEFYLDRFYFGGKKKLTDDIVVSFMTDMRTSPDAGVTTKRMDIFMKTAFIEFKNVVRNASLIVGQQGTPWISNEEKAWKYRVLRKTISDDRSLLTSSDFGLALKGESVNKKFDYHVLLSNGEGYGAREETGNKNAKDFTGRLSYRMAPTAPRISLYADKGSASKAKSDRFGAMIDQQISLFSYGVSYLSAKDAATKKAAWSLFGNYDFEGKPWSVYGRYDIYDPSKTTSNNEKTAIIGGVAYKMDKSTLLTLSGHVDKDDAPAAGVDARDMTVRAAIEVNY